MDLYAVLGVEKTASARALKAAYHRESLRHHPDRGGDTSEMQRLAHAYAVLSDPEKRRDYDRLGREDAATGDVLTSIVGLLPWLGGGLVVGVATFVWKTAWLPTAAGVVAWSRAAATATEARQQDTTQPRKVAAASLAGFLTGWVATAAAAGLIALTANLGAKLLLLTQRQSSSSSYSSWRN